MTNLDLSRRVVSGGFFVHKYDRGHTTPPFDWAPAGTGAIRVVGTYENSSPLLGDALLEMVRAARKKVFVAAFLVGDDNLVEALIDAAQRLRGGVYVITALDGRSLRQGLWEYADDDDVGQGQASAPEARAKYFSRLTSGGVYVRGHEDCHAKFAVIDDAEALVGSANFVSAGFSFTGEIGVHTAEPGVVQEAARLFASLWSEGCTWEIPPGRVYSVSERAPGASLATAPSVASNEETHLVWTNGDSHTSLLNSIHEIIDGSKDELLLSTYSLVGMRECPELLFDPLRRARARGVRVSLFVRQRNAWPAQMDEILELDDMGVEIFGDTRNHAKVAIGDRRDAVIFSANFDAHHGLVSGVEAGIRTRKEDVVSALVSYYEHARDNANTLYCRDPFVSDLDGQLAAKWCSKWPFGGPVEIRVDTDSADRLIRTLGAGTVLFEKLRDPGRLALHVGANQVILEELEVTDGSSALAVVEIAEGRSVQSVLRHWLESVRRSQSFPTRGFCPADIRVVSTQV